MDGRQRKPGESTGNVTATGWLSTAGHETSSRMESRHNVKPPTSPWLIAGDELRGFIS